MMMTWRRTKGRQEARKRENIFQQEEAWEIIEQMDAIAHRLIRGQLHHSGWEIQEVPSW